MNKDYERKGFSRRRILTAVTIVALFIGSGKVVANNAVSNSFYGNTEQQQAKETLKGTVVDANGQPIIGASVAERGTTNGAITDLDGNFSLNLKKNAILSISSVGYQKQELRATANMKIVLKENSEVLNEVVVVGYGTQKKVNLTGAVSNVDVREAIASRPITDVAKALQGITPGLTITNSTGGIGTESTIHLRGSVGSLSASDGTKPLILLDNVEIPSLNLVNPDDIESISVLKDAASASIYGTRAAWGVILITTKQGKRNDKVSVTYSSNFAWGKPTKMAETASATDNAKYILAVMNRLGLSQKTDIGYTMDDYALGKIEEWDQNYGKKSQSELGEMQLGRDMEIKNGHMYFYRSFDAVNEFTRDWTPQQNHNLSITGGSDKTSYNISLSYLNQTGVMKYKSDSYDRYTLNSSITNSIRDWWKVRTNILFTRSVNDQPYKYTSGQYDSWFYLMRWPRWYPYATYNGKDFRSSVTDIKQGNRETVTSNYIRANLGTEIDPIKNLAINFDYTFSGLIDYQKRNGGTVMAYNMFTALPLSNYGDIYGSSQDRAVQASRYTMSNIFKAYATYQFDIEKKHEFKFMAGMDAETRSKYAHYSERRGLISTQLPEIALATGDQYSYNSDNSYCNDFSAAGFFGRINYNYMQKYLLEVNARYDGSSKFPNGKKFAFFPSVSAGWRASEEKFMDWTKPLLTDLKIRGSWGSIGNQDVANNSFISTMSSSNSDWVVGGVNQLSLSSPSVISKNLTWERVTTLDLGLDLRMLNNELGVSFDWYRRVTSNMHCQGETLPSTFGASSPKINYGAITGTGFELGLDYNHRFKNGLGINARASLSNVSEKITKYNSSDNNIYGNYKGKKLGEIWGYKTDRLFQASDFDANGNLVSGIASQSLYESGSFKFGPGDVKYADLDNSSTITYGSNTVEDHGDLKVIGNSLPKYEYSFYLGFDYKGFDFSTFFQGVGKRDYWGYGAVAIPGGGSSYADAVYKHQMDYWTTSNTQAFYPRPADMSWVSNSYNFLRQTRYLSNMAYLRCKNLTIGYTLPKTWMNKVYLASARIYVSGENLFEFDHMKIPVDPETTDYKSGYGSGSWSFGRSYPYSRTYSFGIQLGF